MTEYAILKSGLFTFDVARAYGLAQLLQTLAQGRDSPRILDRGGVFLVSLTVEPRSAPLESSDLWRAVFAENNWQRVFLTYKRKGNGAWSSQRDNVKRSLENCAGEVLARTKAGGLAVSFDGKFALPGSLDPVGFKGLKSLTAGSYSEGQTKVDEVNWALGCLGAAIAQRYRIQKAGGKKWEYFVSLPTPEEVRFSNFNTIRNLVYDKGLSYNGVRNAAAHFSLLLADAVRKKAQGNPRFPARFSNVLYFSLFPSGGQFKPSVGGAVNVAPFIEIALSQPETAQAMFKTWNYLFRRGSAQGNKDLAQAITEFILHPNLKNYERHVRIFTRYIVAKGASVQFQYSDQSLKEVLSLVSS